MIVAIDGPAGSGKSSVAKALAKCCRLVFLDTGAMYRTVTLLALEAGITPADTEALCELTGSYAISFRTVGDVQHVFADDRDVTADIRTPAIDGAVSAYSAVAPLRKRLVALQQSYGGHTDLVAEGRDIGTVVFPNADLKIFLTASPEARAARRAAQRRGQDLAKAPDIQISRKETAEILDEIIRRDTFDSTRETDPLRPAADAHLLDTSDMSFEEVLAAIIRYSDTLTERSKGVL